MEHNTVSNLNENTKITSYKRPANGQASKRPDTLIPPAKPARTLLAPKRDNAPPNSQDNGKAANSTAETDEIEFLLEEIKDLDVPACRTDSEQDFEIAGSRVDLESLQLDSPIDTSWYYYSIIFSSTLFDALAFRLCLEALRFIFQTYNILHVLTCVQCPRLSWIRRGSV